MTRLAAVEQMAKLASAERKEALLEALADSLAVVRLTAVTALSDGFPRDPAVVDRLLVAARGDLDADVREEAHRALAASGDPRVLALAVETLDSADATLDEKLAAAETLDRVTGRTTATDLADRLDGAEEAADELGVAWEEWLAGRKDRLSWDEEAGRFVEGR